jgi:hypothetical protein
MKVFQDLIRQKEESFFRRRSARSVGIRVLRVVAKHSNFGDGFGVAGVNRVTLFIVTVMRVGDNFVACRKRYKTF